MIFVALGANLSGRFESPRAALVSAIEAMRANGIKICEISRLYLTAPVPVSDQPWYHNAVVRIQTQLSAYALLETLQSIENEFGRVRTVRNAPRVLDLDLIAYNDTIIDRPELIVPHPRAHERAFVLMPLADIAPAWVHPISGKTISEMIEHLPAGQIAQPQEAPFP